MDSEIHTWSLLRSFVGGMMDEEFFKQVATFALSYEYLKVMLWRVKLIASFPDHLIFVSRSIAANMWISTEGCPVIWSILGMASVMV